jgi:hypothetical protein
MSASVYQGESRAIPRWTILVLLIKSCIDMTAMILFDSPHGRTRANVPVWLRLPWTYRPLAVALALLVLYALIQFGRRRREVLWGTTALSVLVYLNESQAAYTGSEERMFFLCGAGFAGWLFGTLFAKALEARAGQPPNVSREDELGEAGAAGAFVATYLEAFASKLILSGTRWGEGSRLLSIIVGRHSFSGGLLDGYVLFVVAHPSLATFLALGTLFIEGSMVLYLVGPRLRMTWGALIFGMHLNIYLLMGVKYFVSMIIALALSFPWPRILRRLRGQSSGAPNVDPPLSVEERGALRPVAWRAAGWMAVVGWLSLLLWFGVHADDSTRLFVEPGGHWESRSGDAHSSSGEVH